MAAIEAVEGAYEVDGCGGQVHDEVVDCLGDGNDFGRGDGGRIGMPRALGWDGDGVLGGGCQVEEFVCCVVDEFVAVFAEWADVVLYLLRGLA